ncbi:MAG TPA: hypothetical protein ENN00_00945 [Bacillaceae bacterium]|nr:hypothetical protein [Bacillaceae bacterium]
MVDRTKKWEALKRFLQTGPLDPPRLAAVAFLAGRLERVRFVSDIESSPVGVRISTRKRALWPNVPFFARVHGVEVPDPFLFIAALATSDETIDVRLEVDPEEREDGWLDAVLEDAEQETPQERVDALRAEIDRLLDIYNEIRHGLEGAKERREDYRRFLEIVQRDIEALTRELRERAAELNGRKTPG